MLARMTGKVIDVNEASALIEHNGLAYEVLLPGYAVPELAAVRGSPVTLHTLEFLEGSLGGGNLIPRLVGFPHPEDKAFFNRFLSVKGIGIRKALRALDEPMHRIAAAIEEGDAKLLSRLPGIGRRAADQIIAELRGKVSDFAIGAAAGPAPEQSWTAPQRDALEVLTALGERRGDAERWVARAAQLHPETGSPDGWVKAAYRIKAGVEA